MMKKNSNFENRLSWHNNDASAHRRQRQIAQDKVPKMIAMVRRSGGYNRSKIGVVSNSDDTENIVGKFSMTTNMRLHDLSANIGQTGQMGKHCCLQRKINESVSKTRGRNHFDSSWYSPVASQTDKLHLELAGFTIMSLLRTASRGRRPLGPRRAHHEEVESPEVTPVF